MPLDYSFDITTRVAPEKLMRIFLLSLGLTPDPTDQCAAGTPRFHASAGRRQEGAAEELREVLGFRPDVSFSFQTGGSDSLEAKAEIVRGTLAICRAVEGDAALLFNGEIVLFTRRGGTLYVNSAYWRGDYSLFSPPYVLEDALR